MGGKRDCVAGEPTILVDLKAVWGLSCGDFGDRGAKLWPFDVVCG